MSKLPSDINDQVIKESFIGAFSFIVGKFEIVPDRHWNRKTENAPISDWHICLLCFPDYRRSN